MNPFQLNIPAKIYFGRGCLSKGLAENKNLFLGNIMVVTTGRSLTRLGYVDLVKDCLLKINGVEEIIIFDNVSADPSLTEVQEGITKGTLNRAAAVIGFGGGSAMDAAKAIAAGIGMNKTSDELFYGKAEITSDALPVIAVPTTAGTGSELSKAAIITDKYKKKKDGIRGSGLFPKLAIIDPAFTDTVPLQTTAETGFDVFAHALESYISLAGNDFTRNLSETAMAIAGRHLPRLLVNLSDTESRDMMSYASMLMGINLGNASTCLPHRLQYPLGALTGSSHGLGLSALFPAWLELEYDYAPVKLDKAASILSGAAVTGKNETLGVITGFIKGLPLTSTLFGLNISNNDIPWLVREVSGNISNDPASAIEDVIRRIYQASL